MPVVALPAAASSAVTTATASSASRNSGGDGGAGAAGGSRPRSPGAPRSRSRGRAAARRRGARVRVVTPSRSASSAPDQWAAAGEARQQGERPPGGVLGSSAMSRQSLACRGQILSARVRTVAGMSNTDTTTTTAPRRRHRRPVPLSWDELAAAVDRRRRRRLPRHHRRRRPPPRRLGRCPAGPTSASGSRRSPARRRRPTCATASEVAMTCAPPARAPTCSSGPRPASSTTRPRSPELWADGVLPYDPAAVLQRSRRSGGPLRRAAPDVGSIHSLGPGPVRRWRRHG